MWRRVCEDQGGQENTGEYIWTGVRTGVRNGAHLKRSQHWKCGGYELRVGRGLLLGGIVRIPRCKRRGLRQLQCEAVWRAGGRLLLLPLLLLLGQNDVLAALPHPCSRLVALPLARQGLRLVIPALRSPPLLPILSGLTALPPEQ